MSEFNKDREQYAIWSSVLGIASIAMILFDILGLGILATIPGLLSMIVAAVAAIPLGVFGLKSRMRWLAIVGIACGSLVVLFMVYSVICAVALRSESPMG